MAFVSTQKPNALSPRPKAPFYVLGIESSCDESSASVVRYEPQESSQQGLLKVRSLSTFSQISIHQPFGGVVPEVASRNHLVSLFPMIEDAMREANLHFSDLSAIAVTNRPGLMGALLVGVTVAKTLSYAVNVPLVPIHHLEGHACSLFLDQSPETISRIQYPLLLMLVSGGHTQLCLVPGPPETWPEDLMQTGVIARSRDDAAGEAFDKTAKLMGYPYPGGAWIDQGSEGGNPKAYSFPRALPQRIVFDFSFSGLKTSVAMTIEKLKKEGRLEAELPHLCASVQEAIVDSLCTKAFLAARHHGCKSLALVGGVAANRCLRARLESGWEEAGLLVPPLFPMKAYCTDNAAMIAAAGATRALQGYALTQDEALRLGAHASGTGKGIK